MPNFKSAIKRVKVTEKKTAANKMKKSEMRTAIKKTKASIAEGNVSAETGLLKTEIQLKHIDNKGIADDAQQEDYPCVELGRTFEYSLKHDGLLYDVIDAGIGPQLWFAAQAEVFGKGAPHIGIRIIDIAEKDRSVGRFDANRHQTFF